MLSRYRNIFDCDWDKRMPCSSEKMLAAFFFFFLEKYFLTVIFRWIYSILYLKSTGKYLTQNIATIQMPNKEH